MKIFEDDKKSKYKSSVVNKNSTLRQYKTTNVNVLLNRVRLDKKKSYRKKILFSVILLLIIGTFAFLNFV
jgi:hypothetical protein